LQHAESNNVIVIIILLQHNLPVKRTHYVALMIVCSVYARNAVELDCPDLCLRTNGWDDYTLTAKCVDLVDTL